MRTKDDKSEIRKFKVEELKSQLGAYQLTFMKPILQSQAGTEASFRIANVLVKHKKSFQDGEMIKKKLLLMLEMFYLINLKINWKSFKQFKTYHYLANL